MQVHRARKFGRWERRLAYLFLYGYHGGERIYWFSPSCDVDHQMKHIKRYVEEQLQVPITEKWCYSEWDPEVL